MKTQTSEEKGVVIDFATRQSRDILAGDQRESSEAGVVEPFPILQPGVKFWDSSRGSPGCMVLLGLLGMALVALL